MLQQLKHYVFPANPVDDRVLGRLKRGAIHYAHTGGRSAIAPLQHWLRKQSFTFRHGVNGSSTRLKLSGGDLTHLWVADEVLGEKVYRLDAVPFVPDLVLDLGANIGLFTLIASARWPKSTFICVEPHPTTFSYLRDNLELNGVQAITLQCAVEERARLWRLGNEGAVFQALTENATGPTVLSVPLSALLPREAKLLIKMDIEGSEEAALNGLSQPLPESCFIFIELHRGDASLDWARRWAANNGFIFTAVRRREDAIDGFLARPEAGEHR